MKSSLSFKKITKAAKTPESTQIRDRFQTPRYAAEMLLPFIPKSVTYIWECAVGDGRIARVFDECGYNVSISDIRDDITAQQFNFVTQKLTFELDYKWAIITNPPYSIKELFISKAFDYGVPFAFLINADYSGRSIDWVKKGCEKIIPTRRINYITPNILKRIHDGEGDNFNYKTIDEVPSKLLYKYSSSQFHSMWLTWGFNLGKTETFVDIDLKYAKENMV